MLILASNPKMFPEFLEMRWVHAYKCGYVDKKDALKGIEADKKRKAEIVPKR